MKKSSFRRLLTWVCAAACMMGLGFSAMASEAEKPVSESASLTAEIPVEVAFEGEMPDPAPTFTVKLTSETKDAPMPADTADGVASFDVTGSGKNSFTMEFSKLGVYIYKVSQEVGTDVNVVYDETEYTLYVYILASEDGSLYSNVWLVNPATEEKQEGVLFTNKGKKPAKLDPPLQKIVETKSGTPADDEIFTFQMKPDDPSAPMPEPGDAKLDPQTGVLTKDVKGPGSYEFGWMTFDFNHVGKTYVYTISEIDRKSENYTYDANIYKMTVVVSEKDDAVVLDVTYTGADGKEADKLVFTNIYEEPEETTTETEAPPTKPEPTKPAPTPSNNPVTGDSSHAVWWLILAGAACIGLVALILTAPRKQR